ncbi:MAG TPA: hypothetical protein VG734_08440 [Lacunisphaera sp.]|nr:hypothetical protein [Lacunisphaera sp.]
MRHFRLLFLGLLCAAPLGAWDYTGHRIVNTLALASLPPDFPGFVRQPANSARVVYLANLPDRWRNVDPWLRQSGGSWADHYIDIEDLPAAGMDPLTVPSLRFDFAVAFAAARAAHLDKFPAIDPAKNTDHTREWAGFAPWAIAECFGRLRSAFGYLKAYQELGGTPEEIANAEADVIYAMGVMGHYVGDCAQPLHTTIHHNGWVGANPSGYTKWPGFHSWIDSGLINKAGIKAEDLLPRASVVAPLAMPVRADGRDPIFVATMDYILEQNKLVEPLYRLDKEGKLSNEQEKQLGRDDRDRQIAGPVDPAGREFIEKQLLKGGRMLGQLWLTAWKSAPMDLYLRTQLAKRAGLPPPAPETRP